MKQPAMDTAQVPNAATGVDERAALQPEPISLIQQIVRTYYELLPPFERYIGVSRARWGILSQLRKQEQVSQAVLQQRLQVDGAAITRQVKQLEAAGLVQRCVAPHDNRFTLVALTEQGRQLAESLVTKREQFEQRVTDGISPQDIAIMQRCLSQIRENAHNLLTELVHLD